MREGPEGDIWSGDQVVDDVDLIGLAEVAVMLYGLNMRDVRLLARRFIAGAIDVRTVLDVHVVKAQ